MSSGANVTVSSHIDSAAPLSRSPSSSSTKTALISDSASAAPSSSTPLTTQRFTSFAESDTHSTSTPINPQSPNSGSPSLTASDHPMPSSVIASGPQSSISSQPTHIIDRPVDTPVAVPDETTSMSSSSSPPGHTSVSTSPRGDAAPGPSPTTNATSSTKAATSPSVKPAPTSLSTRKADPTSTTSTGGPGKSSSPAPAPAPAPGPATTQKSASTTVSVVPIRASTHSTVFTTITSSPESTLSAPSSIFVTNSADGLVSLTAPPLVTVLSTSTEADGALVTFTHLVANPPNSVDTSKAAGGFLNNQGQVAGVFAVVGIVTTAFFVALVWFIRRHRKRQRRKAWFASLRQYPPSPFGDSYRDTQEGNFMRSVQTTSDIVYEPRTVNYGDMGYRPHSQGGSTSESTGLGLTGVGTVAGGTMVPLRRPGSGGDPFRDPPHAPQNTPVSFAHGSDKYNEASGASIAPSSPSIYPESLSPIDDPPSPTESDPPPQPRSKLHPDPHLRRALSVPGHVHAPPRPPRSHLRESHKPTDLIPLTPPASLLSHGHTLEAQPTDLLERSAARRTLLNVRPRTAPESPNSQASRGTFGER